MLTFPINGCVGQGEKRGEACRVVCGACRTFMCRIRDAHEGVTDDEYAALQKRHKDSMTPLKRSHVRALRMRNVERESEWPMLSVRIPRGLMQSMEALAETTGRSRAEVVRALLTV